MTRSASNQPLLARDEHGVAHVHAADEAGLYWGMGRWHAHDRGMQMLLMRILGRGQASEYLDSSGAMLEADVFFRQMNWGDAAAQVAARLPERVRRLYAAYCDGANAAFARRIPWELRLLGYRPDPWTIADSIVLTRLTGYLSLAQSQADIERLLIQMVQAGIPRPMLEELFPGILSGLDEELIGKIRLGHRIVPEAVRWSVALPRMMASNNWVVSGSKTASSKPMLANDPHLETNRLPCIWYEIALKAFGRYAMGATMPGLPAILIGRTPDLAWGVTYAFMDAVDSWVERCRDGKCFREPDQWVPPRLRKEVIRFKGRPPVETTIYENEHGVLDGDPFREGYYLATRWSGGGTGEASLRTFADILHATDVQQGMSLLGKVESAWNWVLADRHGNIGYQMSGLMPRRREGANGFLPLPGWKKENDWSGFVPPEDLPRCLNPDEGFFITANNDLNAFGRAKPITIAMGNHRAERIRSLLAGRSSLTVADMFAIQNDNYSLQAEQFMRILRPLLPDTRQGQILRNWDCRYPANSQGASLFEEFYGALLQEMFRQNGIGTGVGDFLVHQTSMVAAFFANLDRVLLSEQSPWFGGVSREELYRRALARAMKVEPLAWGDKLQITLRHLLFQGKLPGFLGFDRGPYRLHGGRATVHQAQVFQSHGRLVAVTPSFHMVTDLAEERIHTNLCGGPSDRRFSRWYASDTQDWLNGVYKAICPLVSHRPPVE